MWYAWTTLLLVSCTLVKAEGETTTEVPVPVATTRAPPKTLDRQAAELVWKNWLETSDSINQNAPKRRITTKSLFITPLVCPKGQRLDRNACIQVVSVNADEHERILLETLNAIFTTPPTDGHVNTDVVYDYGEEEPGPLQLSIPIGSDPQAAPLQGQEPYAQAQEVQPNYINIDKKDGNLPDGDAIKAELELLSLSNTMNQNGTGILNQNVLTNILHSYPDKPKRDSPILNLTEVESLNNSTEVGQKEVVYGHVNIDPILYNNANHNISEDIEISSKPAEIRQSANSLNESNNTINTTINSSTMTVTIVPSVNNTDQTSNCSTTQLLKKDAEQIKLKPENDYSDIGEAIKLISRYADVTTDDNFAKEQNKHELVDDSVLGTRTKAQYRRNKPKGQKISLPHKTQVPQEYIKNDKQHSQHIYQPGVYFRYPWSSQHSLTPPPDYPFRHLQDYWPGLNRIGGVYNTHENPRRHHHSYPHNFRLHNYPHAGFVGSYPEHLVQRAIQHHANPIRSPSTGNQNLYNLLGLRHWFSSEGTSKR